MNMRGSLNVKTLRSMWRKGAPVLGILMVSAMSVGGVALSVQAETSTIELSSKSVPPGATLSLSGTEFGSFLSAQNNRVTVNGIPALVQRWESDLIEIKVPFKASSGPVEIVADKRTLQAGTLTIVRPKIEAITPTETERGAVVEITG
ncbi:MAG: hypothetical protein OEY86_13305, partial [Nitrospira sp.]|nr:hypothetical protein [Nitrospira sp.]